MFYISKGVVALRSVPFREYLEVGGPKEGGVGGALQGGYKGKRKG